MIGKVKSRSLDMESNLEYDFQHTLYKNNEESKKKTIWMKEFILPWVEENNKVLPFLWKLNCNNGRTRDRGK